MTPNGLSPEAVVLSFEELNPEDANFTMEVRLAAVERTQQAMDVLPPYLHEELDALYRFYRAELDKLPRPKSASRYRFNSGSCLQRQLPFVMANEKKWLT